MRCIVDAMHKSCEASNLPLMRLQATAKAIRDARDESNRRHLAALTEVTADIHTAALKQFHSEERHLIAVLNKALSGAGVPLAALSVCGRGTEEVRFTKLLAYFLDPRKPHGLHNELLRAFLEPELQGVVPPGALPNWDAARVDAEYDLKSGGKTGSIIDILIRMPSCNIFIEEKILSAESNNDGTTQLARYTEAIGSNPEFCHAPRLLIFLTPHGREASDSNWQPLSHGEFFSRAARLLNKDGITRTARHNLCCLLWDLLMGPMSIDEDMMSELRTKMGAALRDPICSIELKRWCATRIGSDTWPIMLRIAEVIDEPKDE
jgi:hypothetical protein